MFAASSVLTFTVFGLRQAALLSMALWLGGFTFYSADVIWILHDELGSIEAGFITQRVSEHLNWIGLGTVATWCVWMRVDRLARSGLRGRMRIGLLTLSTACLFALFFLHGVLDRRLEQNGLSGFYRWHRYYLIVSTLQWAANLGLLLAFKMTNVSNQVGENSSSF